MKQPAHKTEGVNRTKTMRFYHSFSTGKERDEETGYGYFGARYMDHELMTMWLSVDPLADKYPSISPYNYCMWNPIRLIDPDGREIGDFYDQFGNYLGTDNIDDKKVYQTTREAWNRHISGDPSGSVPIVAGLGNNEYDNLKLDPATDCLGEMNEYGLIQLTKMGNPNIVNHPSEDTYSYTNQDGVVMPKGQYGDDWASPATAAAFNYAVKTSGVTVVVNDASAYDGVTNLGHKTHRNGTAIDLRYVTADGKGCNNYQLLTPDQVALNNKFIQCLQNAGFTRSISGGQLKTTHHDPKIHSDHLHVNR